MARKRPGSRKGLLGESQSKEIREDMGRLLVPAEDGVVVAVRVFEPIQEPWAVVVVSPATAMPQSYYAPFAQWLAQWGLTVVTYDYRGVGDARPASLRGFPATLGDWAKDARAVLRFASRTAGPRCPLVIVGHSFGGQLLGLVDEMGWAAGAVLVGSQLAHWRHWQGRSRWRVLAFWYLIVPVLTRLTRHLPGWAGLGTPLPAGVARQWSRWARHREYLMVDYPEARARFRRFTASVLAYSFTDDDIAPGPSVDHLLSMLGTKRLEHRRIAPADLGRPSLGHFGFFRSELGEHFWPEVLSFVRRIAIREARLRSAWVLPNAREVAGWSSSDSLAATR